MVRFAARYSTIVTEIHERIAYVELNDGFDGLLFTFNRSYHSMGRADYTSTLLCVNFSLSWLGNFR